MSDASFVVHVTAALLDVIDEDETELIVGGIVSSVMHELPDHAQLEKPQ